MTYEDLFRHKSVAVTGGTGSFGHFIVRELLKFEVSEVVVFSRDEEKQLEMRREFPDPRLQFIIGDVRDRERVLESLRGDYVYHAAALKIISTCEENPSEAYKTNLLGSMNVKEACIRNGVSKALLVNTDKAVKPVNTYGMTKALAEKLWFSPIGSQKTVFGAVRYGNVIGSRGSIIPLFKELIKNGRPIPITDRAMSRFLLTLEQAIKLVFEATMGTIGGEILVPKNPACRIVALVEALAGKGYPIEDIGIRPGEKVAEILISEEEIRRTEDKGDYYLILPHGRLITPALKTEFSSDMATQLDVPAIRELLQRAGFL